MSLKGKLAPNVSAEDISSLDVWILEINGTVKRDRMQDLVKLWCELKRSTVLISHPQCPGSL
eukprot:scaffold85612_cov29-Prasinocladus_malaysianus.AAC.2